MRILKNENGQVLAITAACLGILMGFMALAVDVGTLFRTQRQMQIAADAAAVAGALDYKYNASASSAVTQGCAAATANGVTNTCTTGACSSSVSGIQVCMMTPPKDGPNAGSSGLVEAIVQDPYPTFFMRVFKVNAVTVSGRAVAGSIGAGSGCLLTLARSGIDIAYSGSGSLDATNCDIYDDSNASDSIDLSGSGSITANKIGIALTGGDLDTGSGRISPAPINGMAPAADPLVNLPAPTVSTPNAVTASGSCTASSNSAACNPSCTGSSPCAVSLSPGTYTSISDSGGGKLTITNTSSSGTYTILKNVSNSGAGITLAAGNYNIGGNVSNSASGAMNLGAGNYNIVGSVTANSSGAVTIGNGNVTIGGNLTISGAGALSLGTGNYNIDGNFESTGSGGTTIESGSSSANNYLVNTGGLLELTGSGGLSSANATFYTVGEVTITGSGSMSLVAPTTGTYNGVLVFQSRTAGSTASLSGSGSETVNGIFYAPDAAFALTGSGSWNVYLDVIVDSVSNSGSGSINLYDYAKSTNTGSVLGANYGTSITAKMAMVE